MAPVSWFGDTLVGGWYIAGDTVTAVILTQPRYSRVDTVGLTQIC